MADIQEALENAEEIAELTGRDKADVIADLLDDGKLNNSNDIKENTSAIDRATEMVGKTHKLLTAMIPILLLLATSGLELGGIIDLTPAGGGDDEWMWEDEHNPPHQDDLRWGCMDAAADNYDPHATGDDGTCEYSEPEPEPEPECKATMFDVATQWENESNTTNKLEVYWDADWTCNESHEIEVDVYVYWVQNDTQFYGATFPYQVTGSESDVKVSTMSNIRKGDEFYAILSIWVEYPQGYELDDEWKEQNLISPQ